MSCSVSNLRKDVLDAGDRYQAQDFPERVTRDTLHSEEQRIRRFAAF